MKIALFVHCFFPRHFYGTETYTLNLARHLQDMGHETVVVTATLQGEPGNGVVISHYDYNGVPVCCIDKNCIPHRSVKETYYQPAMRGVLKDILTSIRPDMVHVTHLISHTAALLEVTSELGIPTVATLTDFFGFCYNNKLEAADGSLCSGPNMRRTNCLACYFKAHCRNKGINFMGWRAGGSQLASFGGMLLNCSRYIPGLRYGKVAQDIIGRPDVLARFYSSYRAVIAPTRFLRGAYAANGLNVPVHLMHFGVDLPRVPKPSRPPGSPISFGFIGQIAPHKGTDIIIDAFTRLPRGSGVLHIFGPEDQDLGYMADLKKKAGEHNVFFRGTFPKEKMAEVFNELDFLVIPSRWYENSPLVLLNSLASHTPAIVSDVEGMTEFIEDGKNGYVFSRGSVEDLEDVLKGILADPERSRAMSIATEYPRTTRMMASDVLNVYDSVRRG